MSVLVLPLPNGAITCITSAGNNTASYYAAFRPCRIGSISIGRGHKYLRRMRHGNVKKSQDHVTLEEDQLARMVDDSILYSSRAPNYESDLIWSEHKTSGKRC